MGRRRRKHKHKNKNKQQNQQQGCGHANCDGQCKTKEPEAEIVEIETQAELQELLDLIMEHGAARSARWQEKHEELNNALLEDAGIPLPPKPAPQEETTATVVNDDSAI